jgi:hypothetical protein
LKFKADSEWPASATSLAHVDRFLSPEAVSKEDLKALTTDQLVDRFAEIGIAQGKALWDSLGEDDYSEVIRLFNDMKEIDEELRARGRAARLALMRLYNHRNVQVRLHAAKVTLGVAPVEARNLIEQIAKSGLYPQAGDAGMTLDALDEGIFKPD